MKIIRPIPVTDATLNSSNQAALDTGISDYNAGTTYDKGDLAIVNSPSSTVTITNASPAVITWTAFDLPVKTPVVFSTSGALPTGITAGRAYFIHSEVDANRFRISASIGGAPIVTTSAGSGTHTCTASTHDVYESLQAGNTGHVPRETDSLWWLKVGSTNRWKMFDDSPSSQTTGSSVAVSIDVISLIDSVVLLNLSGSSVNITLTDDVEGEVYNQDHDLTATSGIDDWWLYLFEPIDRSSALFVGDLPPVFAGTLEITITEVTSDALVGIGCCIIGLAVEAGGTQYGAGVGIQDYSVIEKDAYANYLIKERKFSDKANFTVSVKNENAPKIKKLLTSLRATPAVFIGADGFETTYVYGLPIDWDMNITYTTHTILTLQIEGMP